MTRSTVQWNSLEVRCEPFQLKTRLRMSTLGLLAILLLQHISKTDAHGENSSNGFLPDLECGPTLFTNASGRITLPRNPTGSKPTSVNCTYIISAARMSRISLSVSTFDIQTIEESFSSCFNESITISCSSNNSSDSFCLGDQSITPSTPTFADCLSVEVSVRSQNYNIRELVEIPYVVTDEKKCGKTSFTGPNGFVASPNFPASYPHNLSCVYTIEVGNRRTISINFLSFNLEGTSSPTTLDICIHDWLTISCSSEVPSPANLPSNRKYCGQKTTPLKFAFSDCAFLILSFVSDSSVSQGGFRLQYTTPAPELDCGQTLFTNPYEVISLPSNPTDYLARVNCSYNLSTTRLSRVSMIVSLLQMRQLLQSFPDCSKEKLTISCVSVASTAWTPQVLTTRTFCASSYYGYSSSVFPHCQSLVLSIVSAHYEFRGSFRIPYTAVLVDADCGTTSFAGPTGYITSPRFPLSSPHALNCVYTLQVSRRNTVLLQFLSFSLEGSYASGICLHDWLTISCMSDGSNAATTNSSSIRRHCGQKPTTETLRFSDCDELSLNFVTDSTIVSGGFRIQYTIKETDNSTSNVTDITDLDCGETVFTNSTGIITLPTNPTGLKARVNCNYTISTNRTSKISMNISLVEMRKLLESFQDCNTENLEVSCIPETTAYFISTNRRLFCRGTSSWTHPYLLNRLLFFNCRKLRLTVRSSSYSYGGTFPASFTVVANDADCGNTAFTGPTGFITSPRFPLTYPHSLNCFYSVDFGPQKRISLQSLSFELEGTSSANSTDYCIHDWLTVSCSPEGSAVATSSGNRKYCGKKAAPLKLSFSNCSALTLNFVTDSTISHGGFRIQYRVTPPLEDFCGVSVYNSPSGVISLPSNYTDYGDSIDCKYVINATRPSLISLTIWSISLRRSDGKNCQHDWLLMTCLDDQTELDHKVNHRSCNYLNSNTQITFPSCSAVQLVYHGDSKATGETFRIEYTVIGHVTVTAKQLTTSVLTTPRTPATRGRCSTGCEMSSDATFCECFTTQPSTTIQPDGTTATSDMPITAMPTTSNIISPTATAARTVQSDASAAASNSPITASTPDANRPATTTVPIPSDGPISQTTMCDVNCSEMGVVDRSNCRCPSTQSDEVFANTQMSHVAAKLAYSFLVPIAVIIIITVAVFLVFLWFRGRFRSPKGEELLLKEMNEDVAQTGCENGDDTEGLFVGNSHPA